MERIAEYPRELFKRALCSISFLSVSAAYTVFNRYTGKERQLATVLDSLIPFNKYFILPYISWYLYVTAALVYFCLYDERNYYKLLTALSVGTVICYFIYIVFPTTVPRPVQSFDNGLIGSLMKWLYANDNPYNCFPSIHVLNTVTIAIFVQKDDKYIKRHIKAASLILAVLIIYSTLAIKQHVIFDALGGIVIAGGLWCMVEYKEINIRVRILLKEMRSRSVSET